MKTIDLINKISTLLQNNGIPFSIVNSFINVLHPNPDKDSYTVKEKEENGTFIMEMDCFSYGTKYDYVIRIEPSHKCSISKERATKSNFETTSYEIEVLTVEHSNRSWNNESGFIVTTDNRSTIVDTNRKEFVDSLTTKKSLYDENGSEHQTESTRSEFPRREYKGNFVFGVPRNNFRNAERVYYNLTRREGLDKAINYSQVKDMLGNVIRTGESYYHLSNEHGLGKMNFNLGTISKEDYDTIPVTYSKDELESRIANDYGITHDALMEIYGESKGLK